MRTQALRIPMKASNKIFDSKEGQAATELAILGALVIVAFSFLINYSERLNRQQSYLQQTFRAALKEARSVGTSASYTKVAFRRMANVSKPMELGQLQNFSSSASVLWSDGTSSADGVSKYQLNEDTATDIPYRTEPSPGTTEVSTNTFTNTVNSTTILAKQEGGGNIVTTKTLKASDTLQADVDISGGHYSFTHTLGADGKYYPGSNTLERSRSMQ